MLPEEEVFETSEAREQVAILIWEREDFDANSFIGLDEEIFKYRILAGMKERWEMRQSIVGLVSEEVELEVV